MGNDRRRGAKLAIDLVDGFKHEDTRLAIERTGRFVAQQNFGLLGNRTGDRDTLLLTAGELRRKMIRPLAQVDEPQCVERIERALRYLGDQCHVLLRRQAWDQVVELENETNVVTPEAGQLGFVSTRELVVTEAHGTRGGGIQAANDIQECRLSRPGRTQDDDELALVKIEIGAS